MPDEVAKLPVSDDEPARPHGRRRRCKATSHTTGAQCGQLAMRGQAVCRWHGGAAPNALAAARRRLALAEAGSMLGIPRTVDPSDALLEALYLAAGDVEHMRLELPDLDGGGIRPSVLGDGVDVRVKLYHEALERLARFGKLAVDAGIAERQVRLKEAEGAAIAAMIVAVIDSPELQLTGTQRVTGRQLAARALSRLLAGRRAIEGEYTTVEDAP